MHLTFMAIIFYVLFLFVMMYALKQFYYSKVFNLVIIYALTDLFFVLI